MPPCDTPMAPDINESVMEEQVEPPAAVSAVMAWLVQVCAETSV